eukprot:1902085-Amphidinium_carterae.9
MAWSSKSRNDAKSQIAKRSGRVHVERVLSSVATSFSLSLWRWFLHMVITWGIVFARWSWKDCRSLSTDKAREKYSCQSHTCSCPKR